MSAVRDPREPVNGGGNPEERPSSKTGMSGGRIAMLVAGSLVTLVALALLAGGAAILAFNHTEPDSAGFFSTANETFATDGYAIVSDELDVGTDGPDWLFEEGRLATVRVRGASQDGERELFIGIAPTAQVRDYLAETTFATVSDLNFDPFRVTYRPSSGTSAPGEPGGENFWSASVQGSGSQSLEWDVAKGNWSVVVMNADASPGVHASLSLGAKVGFIFWVGVGLIIAGALFLVGGVALIYLSVRRPAAAKPTAVSATA
jgi:hypothetical protein